MFRSNKLGAQLYNRLVRNRMNSTSSVSKHSAETSSSTPTDKPSQEASLIPEHLRYKEKSSFKSRFQGDTGPLIPAVIMLIGGHVYLAWYLFGGEFESDFEDEKVEVLSDFVANTKRRYHAITSRLGLEDQDEAINEVAEEENLVAF